MARQPTIIAQPRRQRVRNVSQGVTINGAPTTLSLPPVFWDALDQIAANTKQVTDDVIAAFASHLPRLSGKRAATVRLATIRYFKAAESESFARRKDAATLSKIASAPVDLKEGKIKLANSPIAIKETMPAEYWDALKDMNLPKARGVPVVDTIVSRSTFAPAPRQIGIAALLHYHAKASQKRFPSLTS